MTGRASKAGLAPGALVGRGVLQKNHFVADLLRTNVRPVSLMSIKFVAMQTRYYSNLVEASCESLLTSFLNNTRSP